MSAQKQRQSAAATTPGPDHGLEQPIMTVLEHAAAESAALTAATNAEQGLTELISQLDEQLASLQRQRDAAVQRKDAASNERQRAQRHLAMYRDAAHHLTQQSGIDPAHLHSVEVGITAQLTGGSDAAPADGQGPEHGSCLHCGQQIIKQPGGVWWEHVANGAAACDPENGKSAYAEPVPPHDPLGQNGHDGGSQQRG